MSEYWKIITISVISKTFSLIYHMVRRNSLLNTQNSTKNVWLIIFFANQQFHSFWWLLFPSMLLAKRWKLHKLLKLISSYNFRIQFVYMANDVSKDLPIALPLIQSIRNTYICMHTSVSLIALCWALTLPLPGTSCGNVTLESAGSSPSLSEP